MNRNSRYSYRIVGGSLRFAKIGFSHPLFRRADNIEPWQKGQKAKRINKQVVFSTGKKLQ